MFSIQISYNSSHSTCISNEVITHQETHPSNINKVTALATMFKQDSVKVNYTNTNSRNSGKVWLYIGKANIYLNW